MLFAKRTLFLVLLSSLAVASASASYRLVLQTGHDGAPVAMERHDRSGNIVSAGEDGRIIVTDPDAGKVLHRFRVTRGRIVDLKTDPGGGRAAVVCTEGGGTEIAVWDWDAEEKVYGFNLDSEPLFLSWSANGRYLVAGNLGTPSVLVLEGRTGRRLSYLQRLPSLYNAGYIGSTETILMTYAASGAIRYWDIRSAALKGSSETIGNLLDVTVLQIPDAGGSKTMMFGHRGESLYLVNRNTGAVMDQLDVPGLADVSVDPGTGDVDVLVDGPTGSSLRRYRITDGVFTARETSPLASPAVFTSGLHPAVILRNAGRTFLMTSEGNLYEEGSAGFAPVVEDHVWRPDSLAFSDESLYIAGGSSILRFTSPFFAEGSRGNIDDLSRLGKDSSSSGTSSAHTGIEVLEDGRLVTWDEDAGKGVGPGYRVFRYPEPDSGRFVPTGSVLQELDVVSEERLLTVDRTGTVALVDASTGESYSTFTALGILDAAYSDEGGFILTGRSSDGHSGTPLEMVDVETRESIPVDDDRFMVYAVEAGKQALYTIGVERGNGGSSTVLLQHEPDKPERSRSLLSVEGEDLNALLLTDPAGSGVFTTLGGTLRRIVGGRSTQYAWREPLTAVASRGKILYGIDGDGALVFWDEESGRSLLEVHFFADGGWVAMPPEGDTIWASPGAIDNVMLYRNGRPVDARRVSQLLEDSASVL